MRNLILTFAGVFFFFNSGLSTVNAQGASVADVERVKSSVQTIGIGPKAKVEVKFRDGAKLKGAVTAINPESFDVAASNGGTTRPVSYADVASVKKQRSGLKPRTWAIIAGAAAAAVIVAVTVLYPVLCDGGAGC